MNNKSASALPEPIVELQRQLDQFRSTRPHRTKLPEALWDAAVKLARQHGVYSVAHPLGLDYTKLKKRLDGDSSLGEKASSPAFVELIASCPAAASEYLVEFESTIGSKMRIQWKGSTAPDWAVLLRAWRESER